MVDWSKYLAPFIAHAVPPHGFMMLVGIIEIIAGIGVLFTPWTKIFAWIVSVWLVGIALDLLIGGYYDIAVRDAVMAYLCDADPGVSARAGATRLDDGRHRVCRR